MARRSAFSGCRNSAKELNILQLIAACTGPYAPPESLKAGRELEVGERTVRQHESPLGMKNRNSAHRTGSKIAWRRISPPTGTDPTKSELIHRIAQKQSQLVERAVEVAVKMMLDQMAQCLAGGGRVATAGRGANAGSRRSRTGQRVGLKPRRWAKRRNYGRT